jgi:hypothetical protein
VFDSHRLENTLIHVPHITAEHQARRYTEPTSFSDPEKAARKLIEIANAAESVQDQRVHIELIPRPSCTPAAVRTNTAPVSSARSRTAGYGSTNPGSM